MGLNCYSPAKNHKILGRAGRLQHLQRVEQDRGPNAAGLRTKVLMTWIQRGSGGTFPFLASYVALTERVAEGRAAEQNSNPG